MQMPMKGPNSCTGSTASRCKFRLQSVVRDRAKRKPSAKRCLMCEYQWKTDELIKEVRDWRILQRLNVITTNEALIWLFHLGFAAPFRWNLISSQLSKHGMTFDDALWFSIPECSYSESAFSTRFTYPATRKLISKFKYSQTALTT